MSPLEALVAQAKWAGGDIAHNLKFIPDDKLNWKPAPDAKSALDIVSHLVGFLQAMAPVVKGRGWENPTTPAPPITDRATAQSLVAQAASAYADALQTVTVDQLDRQVELPFGTFPLQQCATFPVIDLIHHRGQIAYIQTLLGDTQDHFEMMGS